ncbi:MAG: IS200/IS605 family transposase [archaeon]
MSQSNLESYRSNSNFIFSCKYHVIFCPKYRRSVLTKNIQKDLIDILHNVCEKNNNFIIEIEVLEDHVHLILDCDPSYGIVKIIREMKGTSSRILREKYPELKTKLPCLWTRSSFISTVGSVSLERVKKYIEDQKGK